MKKYSELERMEAALAQMGRNIVYPATPDFASSVQARLDLVQGRPVGRFLARPTARLRSLAIVAGVAFALIAGAALAYVALLPVPEGYGIMFTRGGGTVPSAVYYVTMDGEVTLVNAPSPDLRNWGGSWSPDCSRIVFISSRDTGSRFLYDVFVVNADGTGLVNVTGGKLPSSGDSAWSPDGNRIAFTGKLDRQNNEVYVINADYTGLTRLTYAPGHDTYSYWSPDGKRIVFTSTRDGNMEVYVMNADGTDQRNLTNHPANDQHAHWSPDGQHIVFSSNRDGSPDTFNPNTGWWLEEGARDIYVMNADGSGVTRLTDHPARDAAPFWSPDGKWISFTSDRESQWEVMPWNVYVMKPDGSDLKRLVEGWGNEWSTCQPKR